MGTESDAKKLQSLFADFSSGQISTDDLRTLEETLLDDPLARKQWYLYCDIEIALADWAAVQVEKQLVFPKPVERQSSKQLISANVAVTLLASLVLLASLAFWWYWQPAISIVNTDNQSELPVNEVASLAYALDAKLKSAERILPGTTLSPKTIELQSGAFLIEFFGGARVVLEGPAEFELLSSNKARLVSGKLNAHVPKQAVGFSIKTPDGEVIDLGTDFGLVVAEGRKTELHVFSGRVAVASEGQKFEAQTGEAMRFNSNERQIFAADNSRFLFESELLEKSKQKSDLKFSEWKKASETLSKDKATEYHLRFETLPVQSISAAVDSSEYEVPGNIVGSKWVTGRWPDKGGLLFSGPADRIRFTVERPLKVVTLLAWVNIQTLGQWQNALLSSDSDVSGAIHWHLTKRGQLRLEIARDLGRRERDWEAVESSSFLTEDRQHQWILLATTFDGKTIRHYVDGQQVGSGASFTPDSLHIGTAEIGNWSGPTRRNLHAIVDELVILSRVMNGDEIANVFEAGNPQE